MNEIEFKLVQSLRGNGSIAPSSRKAGASGSASASPSPSRGAGPTGILYKELSYAVMGAAIEVHRHLGPGQLESTYERALANELGVRGIAHRRQVPLIAHYKGDAVGEFYADVIVENQIILELKSVSKLLPVHRSQLLSYLRATGLRLGLLMNFHEPVLSRATTRIVL